MFGRKRSPKRDAPPRYNFTDSVRKSLAAAREESHRLGHDSVRTEHILLGLMHADELAKVLQELGVAPEEVRAAVEARVSPGQATAPVSALPYTSRAKKVLELAMAESRERGDSHVGTGHLLLGLLREEKGIAAEVLNQLEVTLERFRSHISPLRPQRSSQLRIRIDDESDRSIYEQIVDRVTEVVATGDLRPGERLPTVRQLADDLDVAPGTVARAYGELERLGIVVTEGARGTRVAERAGSPEPVPAPTETLVGLLRPVAVAAFHLGASAPQLRAALDEAMRGIFERDAA